MGDGIEKFFLGGIACMSAAVITNPIDVVKVRLQLQYNNTKINNINQMKYTGFLNGLKQMYLKEGIKSWYKGLEASLLREASYSTLRMGLYEPIKSKLINKSNNNLLHIKIISAAISGGIGAFIANPTDLIKVRMQAITKDNLPPYKNTFNAFNVIFQQEGIKGLYKGVGPTTQRAMLLTASQLASYDHFKQSLLKSNLFTEGLVLHFFTSILAGLVAAITTSPLDTIKSRYMNQPKDLIYHSPLHCATSTIKNEGFMALYKGFFPNWIRIGPHTVITFIILENLRKLLGHKPL
ncbi:mitochondrial carrier [Neoconidiobolus thromboides FSU 785]|nr:mitochondrial carrier [Neoconidiobolus thromboides FSU 785]